MAWLLVDVPVCCQTVLEVCTPSRDLCAYLTGNACRHNCFTADLISNWVGHTVMPREPFEDSPLAPSVPDAVYLISSIRSQLNVCSASKAQQVPLICAKSWVAS